MLIFVNAMLRRAGETAGAWWENTEAVGARLAVAVRADLVMKSPSGAHPQRRFTLDSNDWQLSGEEPVDEVQRVRRTIGKAVPGERMAALAFEAPTVFP